MLSLMDGSATLSLPYERWLGNVGFASVGPVGGVSTCVTTWAGKGNELSQNR